MKQKDANKVIKKKNWVQKVLFSTETSVGRAFNIIFLVIIVLSVAVVMLETVRPLALRFEHAFSTLEWIFTILFTVEYILHVFGERDFKKYATSFYGVIDLISFLPMYFLLFFPLNAQYFMLARVLRLIRVFRIFKLAKYLQEARIIVNALRASFAKIAVFLSGVILIVVIFGSALYVVEGSINSEQFTSIPRSIYWAIVTITTVGYGDISPITPLGQFIAAMVMLLGYAVIAVPTGIVTIELGNASLSGSKKKIKKEEIECSGCGKAGHLKSARYCLFCGVSLF